MACRRPRAPHSGLRRQFSVVVGLCGGKLRLHRRAEAPKRAPGRYGTRSGEASSGLQGSKSALESIGKAPGERRSCAAVLRWQILSPAYVVNLNTASRCFSNEGDQFSTFISSHLPFLLPNDTCCPAIRRDFALIITSRRGVATQPVRLQTRHRTTLKKNLRPGLSESRVRVRFHVERPTRS